MTALARLLAECAHEPGCTCHTCRLARIVRVLREAAEASKLGDRVYPPESMVRFDHESNMRDALAEAERIAGEGT